MSLYELIQNTIRVVPVVVLLPAFLYLLRLKWYQRFGVMFVLGWVVFAASTLLFWSYSINYAPTQETMTDLAQRDGAPRLFGTLFGWAFGLILLFIFEATRLIYIGFNPLISRLR
ncbi:hypothetical protein FIU95_07790 [Microbulbifer sp. THAF38]|nr:hypothetical protein FIU95_07790 [Microbulbifer sp. THAF38]